MPYALFGCSVGTLIVIELVRRLQLLSETATSLSSSSSSSSSSASPPRLPVHLFIAARSSPHSEVPVLHTLPEDQFIEALRKYEGGTPDHILDSPEMMSIFLPYLRSDHEIDETYEIPHRIPVCSVPMTIMGGIYDLISIQDLLEWRFYTTARASVTMFPANHFFMVSQQTETVSQIISVLRDAGHL